MYELTGYLYCDFAEEGQEPVKGYSCWFLTDSETRGFQGRQGAKVFFPTERFPDFKPQIGDKYLLIFPPKSKRLKAYQKLDQ